MNTRHAQLVLSIVRFGSITAAAKALYITQPTLSATLKQIETQLGEPIFVRGRSPLELTSAGELYVQAARRVLQIETQLEEAIALLHGKQQGRLHIGIPLGRSSELLPQILPDFLAAYPGIHIEITEDTSQMLEQRLVSRELDAAILTDDMRRQDLTYRLIASEEVVLVSGRRTHIAQRVPSGSTISLAEAAQEHFILPAAHTFARKVYDDLLSKAGLHAVQPSILCENMETAKRTCAACQMVTLLPFITLLCDTQGMQRLSYYHLTGEAYLSKICLAHPADAQLPPYAEAFFNLISNRYRAMSAYRM